MKLILTLSAVLGATVLATPLSSNQLTRGVRDDIRDFIDLLPLEKIKNLAFEYFGSDEEFQSAIDYVLSDEFTSLVEDVESMPEVRKFLDFLEELGLPAYEYVNKLNGFLEINQIPRGSTRLLRITGGLLGFIKDARALIPEDKIKALYEQKMQTSKEFAEVVNRLKSQENQNVVNNLIANSKFKNFLDSVEKRGINVREIMDFLSSFLGLHFPKPLQAPSSFRDDITDFVALLPTYIGTRVALRSLNDDLEDFRKLVPEQKIMDVVYRYIGENTEVQEALDYVLSDEFIGLVKDVEAMPVFKEFVKYLEDAGLPASKYINELNKFLEIPDLKRHLTFVRAAGGLKGMIEEIRALIPEDQIKKLYEEKLKSSPEFKALIEKLKDQKSQEVVDKLMSDARVQNLIKKLNDKGIDVQEIFDTATALLGLKFPKQS